jgi:hypothetical protein
MTEPRIRWRNRLAAWLCDHLIPLADPVWEEDWRRQFQAAYDEECRSYELSRDPHLDAREDPDALPF